ncbi:universal stress protein, partial [Candidatus Binatia bacterium]|nr:universal stress protein [Candidatus Binatia bacterium]
MSGERLRTIAVATDFSPGAKAAFAWALELAREHGSSHVLVHALLPTPASAPDLAPVPEAYYRELRDEACAKLAALMARVRPAGLALSVELVLSSSAAGILATAQQRAADVIVLGAPVGSRWAWLVAGSTTTEVMREETLD